MNCIFVTIFCQEQYVNMFYLLLESILIYGNIDVDDTHILVYTSSAFMNKIRESHLYSSKIMKFEINDDYNSVEKACLARLDLFELPSVSHYEKFLYLDTDILVKNDLQRVFAKCENEILYALEEGTISHEYWGGKLFQDNDSFISSLSNQSGFSSGMLLFKNCIPVKELFANINEDILRRKHLCTFYDQPFIVYNAFKYNLYDNQMLKEYAVNNDYNIRGDKTIHHFAGGPGSYDHKIKKMTHFLKELKEEMISNLIIRAKEYIDTNLLTIIRESNELLEGNIFMFHHTLHYTDQFLNKTKNISNLVLPRRPHIDSVMEIGFNSGFSALLMLLSNPTLTLTCFDLGEHSYTRPCFNKLKETFGERIEIFFGDSTLTVPEFISNNPTKKFDLIHIDGGHSVEVATTDIISSLKLSRKGTILIMDDYDFSNLHTLWDHYIDRYHLKKLDIFVYDSPHHDVRFMPLNMDV